MFCCGTPAGARELGENAPLGPDSERALLVLDDDQKTHKTILGNEVIDDDEGWHYAMVFNRVRNSDEKVEDAMGLLEGIFTPRVLDFWQAAESAWFEKLDDGAVKKADLYDKIWEKVVEIMTSEACGLTVGWKPTIDEERIMLMIRLEDKDNQASLADKLQIDMPVKPKAYQVKGITCPKLGATLWQRLGCDQRPPPDAPTFMPFDTNFSQTFKSNAKERIKIANKMIDELLQSFESEGVRITSEKFVKQARQLMRQVDQRSAVMIVLSSRLKEVEAKGADKVTLDALKGIFKFLNEALEEKNKDTQYEIKRQSDGSDESLQKARLARWSPPKYVSVEEYQNTELFEDFTDLHVLRIIRRRLHEFMYISTMDQVGVIESFFPVHHINEVEALEGWGGLRLGSVFQWPTDEYNDQVRAYFGEEVGFFFQWLTYCTRLMFWPGLLSLVSISAPFFTSEDHVRNIRSGFGLGFCLWTAYLAASYNAAMSTYTMTWGVKGCADEQAVLKSYNPVLRGSFKESFIRAFHWFLGLLLVIETVAAASAITYNRSVWAKNPDQVTDIMGFAVTNSALASVGVTLITVNIKVVNAVWGAVSPRIADMENWRTDTMRKDSQVFKMFMVKCIVYYYPFFFLAFIKDTIGKGCIGDACVNALRENLAVFVITHIATVIVTMVVQIATTWWSERGIMKALKAKGKEVKYTYVQAQQLRPEYAGDTDDYMELVISLGYVTMFSTVFPFMSFLIFCSNMLEMRVLAFRMLRVLRRPVPKLQEGIGAWLSIMKALTYASVVVSVGIVVWTLEPCRSWSKEHKALTFIVAEHVLMFVSFAFSNSLPHRNTEDEIAEEKNADARDLILAGDLRPVKANKGTKTCLAPGYKDIHPGTPVGKA